MSLIQPQATDTTLSGDHAHLHRVLAVDSSAPNESIVVGSTGNVGIGTSSPISPLHVHLGTNQNVVMASTGTASQIVSYNDAHNAYPSLLIDGNALLLNTVSGGNVGIGTSSPAGILDVTSTTSAFLPPRMTTMQKNAISPVVDGMVVYDTTLQKLCNYNGSAWVVVGIGLNVYRTTFSNASLIAGVLSVTHNLGQQVVIIQVYDGSNKMVVPDNVTLTDSNDLTITLTSFGTLSGTYNLIAIG